MFSLRMGAVYALVACAVVAGTAQTKKNVILYIGDGYGLAPKTAARMALGQGTTGKRLSSDPGFHILAADKLRYTATVTTHSLNSWITDSAPGASVYACGDSGKVDNEAIAFSVASNKPIPTILEAAKKAGYAVGLVTTTRITHATPAAFASHVWQRDLEDYIAAQYVSTSESEYEAVLNANGNTYSAARDWQLPSPKVGVAIDVLLGGGSRHFLSKSNPGPNNIVRDRTGNVVRKSTGDTVRLGAGKRADGVDLVEIAKTRGYTFVNSRDALLGVDYTQFTPSNNKKLIGMFRDSHCSYEQDRQLTFSWEPSLTEMTQVAIEILKRKSDKGFFLMVEGGRIDHLEHANCGGVGVVGTTYAVESDKFAVADDNIYNGDTNRVANVTGSDYMIKEVLAFDRSIAKGEELLTQSDQTLIFSTSDHECGGFAVVGLHDEADQQANGTKIRTYAQTPKKTNNEFTPAPVGIVRGDMSIGGWYPQYSMQTFQGTDWPVASPTGRRIVVSYGSNPLTNGNGQKVGGTPGNHTPQDIWVGADDNVNGQWASKITGRGLLDNTDIFPIMRDFLNVTVTSAKEDETRSGQTMSFRIDSNYPNPFNPSTNIVFDVLSRNTVTLNIYNAIGQRVRTLVKSVLDPGSHSATWDGKNDFGNALASGTYMCQVQVGDEVASHTMVMLK